jgi:hypothetical protein
VIVLGSVAAAAYILGTSSGKPSAAPSIGITTVSLDGHARQACEKLDKAGGENHPTDYIDEREARLDAAQSALVDLADLARQPSAAGVDDKVTAQLRDWCAQHWIPGQ